MYIASLPPSILSWIIRANCSLMVLRDKHCDAKLVTRVLAFFIYSLPLHLFTSSPCQLLTPVSKRILVFHFAFFKILDFAGYSLNLNEICIFTDSSVKKIFFTVKLVNFNWLNQWKKYFSLLNQFIFTKVISEIWLIYSNLFLAIWNSQISLIISIFWLIQI